MSRRLFSKLLSAKSRRIFSLLFLTLLAVSPLAGQIVRRPTPRPRPARETDIYIVRFRPGVSASERAAVVQGAGAALRINYNITNAASVRIPNSTVLARLRNDPRVLAVFVNRSIPLPITLNAAQGKAGGSGGGGSVSKPKPPSSLSATAISSSEISLAWTDTANNEDGFKIERCTGSGCSNFSEIGQTVANVTSFSNNSGLAASTPYRYRVLAFNVAGSSRYSNIAEATTLPAPSPPTPPPAAPSGLTLLVASASQINLAWVDNSTDESGFRIERCQGPVASCGSFVQVAQVVANVTSHNDTGLAGGTTYTYRIRAYNSNGNSAYSSSAEATTSPAPPGSQVVPDGVQRIGAAPGVMTWTGAGVGVAVVDTGLDFSHLDLGLAPEVPGVNSFKAVGGGTCQDIHGHGTHVAGIVAARNNTAHVVGVAPQAALYCVNVFQPDPIYDVVATDESLIAGLEWIAANRNLVNPPIRVVNMSLGRPRTPEDTPDHPLRVIVKALYDGGISVAVSAGNDSAVEVSTQVPASFPEVMAVASTSAVTGVNGYDDLFVPCPGEQSILADTASYFTTDGAFVGGVGATASAPGEAREDIFFYEGTCFVETIGILSTWPADQTTELSGTSMAAPHVAGVLALMWQKELNFGRNLAPEDARTRIRNSVARIGTAPLDSAVAGYTYDGQREGILWAPAAVGDVPPPPQDFPPTVSITSPANGSTFSSGAIISFQGSATDPENGNLSASLIWTSSIDGQIGTGATFSRTLSGGAHTITASVTDSGGNVVKQSVSITVGSPASPTKVKVTSIVYAIQGPNLLVTVELDNEFGGAVAGAAVTIQLYEWLWGTGPWTTTGTTNTEGKVQFQLSNAPWGCYVTTVTNVVAAGLTWDGLTPDNSFCN